MKEEEKKFCPFKSQECNSSCALYIDPTELNEIVKNKLASVGVLDREKGMCSLKNLSMCMNRQIFEQLSTYLR